ncbi:MAG: hypothetical protein KatS3mg094_135 [Candidatus Parcubacteria bacterium]|nr:MAG: hypothetical protein KatS3mg094_135 [Candidatus Parcubacteria bacterium]
MNRNFLLILSLLLFLGNIGSIFYIKQLQDKIIYLQRKQEEITKPVNRQSLEFLDLLVKKVLKADKEVNFETKLLLENKVRELRDKEILDTWNEFVNSKNETQAQKNIKDLIEILIERSLKY